MSTSIYTNLIHYNNETKYVNKKIPIEIDDLKKNTNSSKNILAMIEILKELNSDSLNISIKSKNKNINTTEVIKYLGDYNVNESLIDNNRNWDCLISQNKREPKEVGIVLSVFLEEDIIPGYDSETEQLLDELMTYKPKLFADVVQYLFREIQSNYYYKIPEFIEVITNLDYSGASPTNYTILSSFRAIDDDSIQEAVIAGFEKWGDAKNIVFLRDMHYANNFIKNYANNTINFLEDSENELLRKND